MDLSNHPALLVLALILGPALVAGVTLLVLVRRHPERVAGPLGALGLALGYLAGHRASLDRWPAWPPRSSEESLWLGAALAAAGALLAARFRARLGAWLVVGAFHAAASALLLRNLLPGMAAGELATRVALAFALPAVVAVAIDRRAASLRGPAVPALLWGTSVALAAGIALTGSVLYAQFTASLAAVLGAAAVVGVLARDARFSRGVALFVVPHVGLLALAATSFSKLPLSSALLLAVAPLVPCSLPPHWLEQRKPAVRWALLLLALAVPLAAALVPCWNVHQASLESYPY